MPWFLVLMALAAPKNRRRKKRNLQDCWLYSPSARLGAFRLGWQGNFRTSWVIPGVSGLKLKEHQAEAQRAEGVKLAQMSASQMGHGSSPLRCQNKTDLFNSKSQMFSSRRKLTQTHTHKHTWNHNKRVKATNTPIHLTASLISRLGTGNTGAS